MARDLASISGRAIGERVLGRLLDRVEARAERENRVIERVPKESLLYDERKILTQLLERARDAGAVQLVNGRHEESHLIAQVVLVDPQPLYAILGRRRPADVAAEARAKLEALLPKLSDDLRGALDRMVAAWGEKHNLVRDLGPGDVTEAVGIFTAAEALLARRHSQAQDDLDMRTFSRRATGNSKFVEGNVGRIADVLRMVEDLPEYLDAEQVLEHHDIRKFPHACLLAGPVTYKGIPLPTEPYIGVAPEMAAHLGAADSPGWLLMIENLASFNRQVREAAAGGIVIYTGGFPSDATLAAIVRLAGATDCPVFHWGDIDPGGIKIAYRIERALAAVGRRLGLHMMDPALATERGAPAKPVAVFKRAVDDTSAVAELVRFMASKEARTLEQEELNPRAPDLAQGQVRGTGESP